MIVYLHGFNSSPQSHKAKVLYEQLVGVGRDEETLHVPALSHWPHEAIAQVSELVEQAVGRVCLVGSSLGGYYATWLAERYALPAVLINPAVRPYRLLADYLGVQRNPYTGEVYELTEAHLTQLRTLDVAELSEPGRFLVFLQTGDEVLDYRDALEYYGAARCRIMQGGNHSFQGFEGVVDELLGFCVNASRDASRRCAR